MLNWWRHLSRVGKIAGMVGAITGAIVGVAAAWPIIHWVVPAHRGYVIEQVGGVQATTNELLIWKFEDDKGRKRSEAANWNIQMQKEQDPQTRTLIQQRIEQLQRDQAEIEVRIKRIQGR